MLTHNDTIADEVLAMFSAMVENKDIYTAGHSKRVAHYSSNIAKLLGLSEKEQTAVYEVGLLHDIGKILTPESILLKPKKLTKYEYNVIKNHSLDGEKMVSFLTPFKHYMPIIRHHHEHYNGYGYPDQLHGEKIPLLSRILCIADAFDAMTTNRIYKPRKNNLEAIKELQKCSGKQFDPCIIEVATEYFKYHQELSYIDQVPQSLVEEERFAFFYKDKISTAYSSEYLNYFLLHNEKIKQFTSCYLIQLHSINHYNKEFGWKNGSALIRKIAMRLKVLFQSSHVFRIFGDDFVILNTSHVNINAEEIRQKLRLGFNEIQVSFTSFPLQDFSFKTWEDFEPYLHPYKTMKTNKGVKTI